MVDYDDNVPPFPCELEYRIYSMVYVEFICIQCYMLSLYVVNAVALNAVCSNDGIRDFFFLNVTNQSAVTNNAMTHFSCLSKRGLTQSQRPPFC